MSSTATIPNLTPLVAVPPAAPIVTATATAPKKSNGFIRFIDAIGHFFLKAAPVVLKVAEAAEPILALTPFGPEYDVVVNAIVLAQKTGAATIAAGANLTNEQKFAIAVQASLPALTTILAEKGITETAAQQAAIAGFVQAVFDLHAGPVVATAAKA